MDSEVIKTRIAIRLKVIKKPLKSLWTHLKMSEGGYHGMFKRDDMKVSTLLGICEFLNMSIDELLDREKVGSPTQVNEPQVKYSPETDKKINELLMMVQDIHKEIVTGR